jgi:uncharacterized protein YgiM (DUF1202 family)
MWQYSMDGTVAGIRQSVDLNIAYFGYDGIEPAHSKNAPDEVGPDVEAMLDFEEVTDQVTAKESTNLRDIPSQDDDSKVLRTLENGEVAQRIAVSKNGWSKLVLDGNTYYAVSNYLTTDLNYVPPVQQEYLPSEMGIETQFVAANQLVTAKKLVNLRKLPSVEREDAEVLYELRNGEIATCVGISDNGWSKLSYNGETFYAVTNYLTTDLTAKPQTTTGDGVIDTVFTDCNEKVTAKDVVNLRSMPSVTDAGATVVAQLKHGEIVIRTGINTDVGWSRIEYNGQTLYCVSSYLELTE